MSGMNYKIFATMWVPHYHACTCDEVMVKCIHFYKFCMHLMMRKNATHYEDPKLCGYGKEF